MNSKSQRKKPMFIKIILENTIKQGRLEIPSGFVIESGNSLRNRVILKVPNGKTWQVRMSKVEEDVWLGEGWVEFAEHHSLKHGHLLVFKYEGNSQFNVMIFDKSATEIDYPGTSRDAKNKEFRGNLASSSTKVNTSANNFTSSNPLFKVDLKSVYMRKKYLTVPYIFIEKHTECESKTVMFKVEDKSWPVKLNVYPKKRVSMFTGVTSFLRDYSLKKGDVCVFELITNNVFSVSIFRI